MAAPGRMASGGRAGTDGILPAAGKRHQIPGPGLEQGVRPGGAGARKWGARFLNARPAPSRALGRPGQAGGTASWPRRRRQAARWSVSSRHMNRYRALAITLLSAVLVACGGGGLSAASADDLAREITRREAEVAKAKQAYDEAVGES